MWSKLQKVAGALKVENGENFFMQKIKTPALVKWEKATASPICYFDLYFILPNLEFTAGLTISILWIGDFNTKWWK